MPRVVQRSKELARILKLPRRTWQDHASPEACELLTQHLRTEAGTMSLFPVQCAGLAELADYGGAFLQLGVGQGKTLISALASRVAEADRPLLFVPANLNSKNASKTKRELRALAQHWQVGPIRIESYEQLSRAESGPILLGEKYEICEACKAPWPLIGEPLRPAPACARCGSDARGHAWRGYLPDLPILDEGHKAKNPKAACTRKIRRYIRERRADGYPVQLVIMSGTLAKRSIKDFAHMVEWTDPLWSFNLEKFYENVAAGRVDQRWVAKVDEWYARCPLPAHEGELMLWADAVDEGVTPTKRAEAGALLILPGAQNTDENEVTRARRGLQRRVFETPGYIATTSNNVADCSLIIECHQVPVPAEVDAAFDKLKHWETPCGLPIPTGIELWAHCRQLSTDFYYRPKVQPPLDWMAARRAWYSKVRHRLQYNQKSLDSIAMVEADVRALGDHGCSVQDRSGDEGCRVCQTWDALVAWDAIRDTFELETGPVWVGTTCLDWVTRWHEENGPGLIWTEWPIVGERIARHLGIEYYGREGLNKDKNPIESEKGDRSAVASIKANGTGRNLQTIWSRACVTSAPTTGQENDQMIGRLHRPGQPADFVKFDYMVACLEQRSAILQALKDADFHAECLGSELKILPGQKSADILLPIWSETGWAWKEPIRV